MSLWRWSFVAVAILGLISGPSALEAGAAALPPIEWSGVSFAFFGSAVAMVFLVGLQLLRREPRPAIWALRLLDIVSVFFVAAGVSAITLTIFGGSFRPYAALFLAIGIGAIMGLYLSRLGFRLRFSDAL